MAGTLGFSVETLRGMSDLHLRFYAEAVQRREKRMSLMLGKMLGSLLDVPTLQGLFGSPQDSDMPEDVSDALGVEREPPPKPSCLYTPLALLLRPELREDMQKQAMELLPDSAQDTSKPVAPGIDMDLVEMERLMALSRRADALRKKVLKEREQDIFRKDYQTAMGIDGVREE